MVDLENFKWGDNCISNFGRVEYDRGMGCVIDACFHCYFHIIFILCHICMYMYMYVSGCMSKTNFTWRAEPFHLV